MSEIVYVYGFVSDPMPSPPRALTGVNGAPVEIVSAGSVQAVLSQLPMDDFGPDTIDARIQDIAWVGARGLEHERVVAWFVDNAEILPVSLFTLFSSVDALILDVRARASELQAALERLHGMREWDLKVTWDQRELATHAGDVMEGVKDLDAEIATAPAGRRFLLERKRADLVKNELAAAARARGRALLEQLAAHASDVVALPVPRSAELPVVLNAALLVRRESEAALSEEAARESATLQLIGIHVQLTGPWAPYRFMDARDDASG